MINTKNFGICACVWINKASIPRVKYRLIFVPNSPTVVTKPFCYLL